MLYSDTLSIINLNNSFQKIQQLLEPYKNVSI